MFYGNFKKHFKKVLLFWSKQKKSSTFYTNVLLPRPPSTRIKHRYSTMTITRSVSTFYFVNGIFKTSLFTVLRSCGFAKVSCFQEILRKAIKNSTRYTRGFQKVSSCNFLFFNTATQNWHLNSKWLASGGALAN